MSYMPKPKGERAAILEMEARLSMAAGGGRASPNVFRVPAMYKWINDPGPARRSRSRSHSTEPPGPAGRRSISTYDDFYESSRRSPSRATPLSPIPGRESRLSSMSTGSWFTSSLADLDSHWNGATIFGIVRPLHGATFARCALRLASPRLVFAPIVAAFSRRLRARVCVTGCTAREEPAATGEN